MLKLLAGNYMKGITIVDVPVNQIEFHLGKNVTRSIQSSKFSSLKVLEHEWLFHYKRPKRLHNGPKVMFFKLQVETHSRIVKPV